MTYKKELKKLMENGNIQPNDVINFVVGKGHWRLPKSDEVNSLMAMLDPTKVLDGATLELDLPAGSSKADKQAMESLKVEIGSNDTFTKKHVIKLWNLAHDARKRKLIIAAIVAGSLVIVTGVTLGVLALMNRDKNVQDTSNVNDEVSDIEIYEDDIPQVDIDTTEV